MKGITIILVLFFYKMSAQNITLVAGTGSSVFSGEGTSALISGVPNPRGGVFDKYGNYYFLDGVNSHRVRKITPSGIVSTFAGNGMGGFSGDGGPATSARLNLPTGIAIDTSGNFYISDGQNNRVRRVDHLTGVITTVAGTGIGGFGPDGVTATASMLWGPSDICIDKFNNIYVADGTNSRVRKIDPSGIISTFAGTTTPGSSGDYGPATLAQLGLPYGIAVDDTGNIYIADNASSSNCVRKVNLVGIITTFAGNGIATFSADGIPATMAQLSPIKVRCDSFNNLFIADNYNNRVYKVESGTGLLYSVGGTSVAGDGGDGGPATSATLNYPSGVALDPCGNLYIPTVGSLSVPGSGRRIRKVTFNPTSISTVSITCTPNDTVCAGTLVTFSATTTGGSTMTFQWYKNGDAVVGATSESYTYTPVTGDSVRCVYTGVDICSFTGNPSSNTINLVVTPLTPPTIALTSTPASSAAIGSTVTVNAAVGSVGSSYTIRWYKNGVPFDITSVPVTTYVKGTGVDVITAKVSSMDPIGCYDTTTSAGITINTLPGGVNDAQTIMPIISLYPNPATDELHVTGAAASYRILNPLGQVLQQGRLVNEYISLSGLAPGMYMLEAFTPDGLKANCRFIKR